MDMLKWIWHIKIQNKYLREYVGGQFCYPFYVPELFFEYVPRVSGGQMPVIEEKDELKVVIPYLEDDFTVVTTEIRCFSSRREWTEEGKFFTVHKLSHFASFPRWLYLPLSRLGNW